MNQIDDFLQEALKEDMPDGDITTDNLVGNDSYSHAVLIAKEDGIISGIEYFKRTFELIGKNVNIIIFKNDGEKVFNGEIIATLDGSTKTILKGERVGLNILQRMSGIASTTNKYVNEVIGSTKILDTRKTTPLLRFFEKKAVRDGGGTNHRYSLSDMVMIKDNHINAAGSITDAVKIIRSKVKTKIEVEVENLEMFKEALMTSCDIIMLDNMSNDDMLKCVVMNNHQKMLEASGNMTLERIKEVSSLGVDYISVGALTHSFKSMDISLKFR